MKSPDSPFLAWHRLFLASVHPYRRKVYTRKTWLPLLVSSKNRVFCHFVLLIPGIALAREVPVIMDLPGWELGKKKKKSQTILLSKNLTRQVKWSKEVIWQYLGWGKKITQHLTFLLIEISNFSMFFYFGFWRMGEGSGLRRWERVIASCHFIRKFWKIRMVKC